MKRLRCKLACIAVFLRVDYAARAAGPMVPAGRQRLPARTRERNMSFEMVWMISNDKEKIKVVII